MPVTLLTAPPAALSRDELVAISAETPSTFEGIPPLTRHHEPQGVRIRVDPPFDGFTGDRLVDGQLFVTEECVPLPPPPDPHLSLPRADPSAPAGPCPSTRPRPRPASRSPTPTSPSTPSRASPPHPPPRPRPPRPTAPRTHRAGPASTASSRRAHRWRTTTTAQGRGRCGSRPRASRPVRPTRLSTLHLRSLVRLLHASGRASVLLDGVLS